MGPLGQSAIPTEAFCPHPLSPEPGAAIPHHPPPPFPTAAPVGTKWGKRQRWGIVQMDKKTSFFIFKSPVLSALECDMLIHCEASNLGDKGADNTSTPSLAGGASGGKVVASDKGGGISAAGSPHPTPLLRL